MRLTELIEEVLEQLQEALPEGWTLRYLFENAEWYQESCDWSHDPDQLKYQYGRLLGIAEAQDEGWSIEKLLRSQGLWPQEVTSMCSCPGWFHSNIGSLTESIQRCDECLLFKSDEEAEIAHAKHCKCGSGQAMLCPIDEIHWIKKCHVCQEAIVLGDPVIHNHRAFCGWNCANKDRR